MTFDGSDATRTSAAEPMIPVDDTPAHVDRLTRVESDEIDGSLCDMPQGEALHAAAQRYFPLP